jgi:CheY-like chemotaxis protein
MKELSDCTVLVVDDTEASVDILVEALGKTYDVSVAMDGPSGLEAVVTLPVNPKKSGWTRKNACSKRWKPSNLF